MHCDFHVNRMQILKATNPYLDENDTGESQPPEYSIIAHSHLGWDWVWQRPQQFLSRLSRNHRILFVESPIPRQELARSRRTLRDVPDFPNVLVLQIEVPAAKWNDGTWVDTERRRILLSVLDGPLGEMFRAPVQWFYDPMAVTAFAGHLNERAIVYDCMDELSLFRGAPMELVRRERELLSFADIVFAGGPKIWEAKRLLNQNCFCLGCGVEADHFGKARDLKLAIAPEIASLPHPIFGYIGVVDERIDYDLLGKLARLTAGSVVMVGPWTKVDPADFPHRPNLHWLGGRDYVDLPAFARAFDVCLMPFAMNEATRFINPTKALEYMATGRPIVSTPVEDVVRQFGEVVAIANDQDAFIAQCQRYARQPDRRRIELGLLLAQRNSWDSVVAQIENHVEDTLARKRSLDVTAA